MSTGAPPPRGWLALRFFLLAVGIVAAGGSYYRSSERTYRTEVEQERSAVAELKTRELSRWRMERLADGALSFQNVTLNWRNQTP